MPEQDLKDLTVGILATDGFECSELMEPRRALQQAGASISIVSPKRSALRGWEYRDWADDVVPVDVTLDESDPRDFDAGKPVAAICHGPWTVIESGAARGRRMTSWPSLKTDIENAHAQWVDAEVVIDGNLVTSRKPDDLPAFNRELIKLFAQSRHDRRANAAAAR